MKSNSFPDPFSVFRLLPGPQHPHCCSLPSLLKVTSFPDPTVYFCPWDATRASLSSLLFSAFFVDSIVTLCQILFLSLGYYPGSAYSPLFSAFFVYSNPFPDPFSVPGLLPGPQHPHCCFLPSLFKCHLFPRSYFCPWAETWDSASSHLFSALPGKN
jgi:hypothetical protein